VHPHYPTRRSSDLFRARLQFEHSQLARKSLSFETAQIYRSLRKRHNIFCRLHPECFRHWDSSSYVYLTVIRPHAALIHNNDCGITPVEPESILPKKHLKIRYLQRQTHIRSYSLDCAHNPSQPDKATSQARYRPTLSGGHGLGGLSNSERLMAVLASGRG